RAKPEAPARGEVVCTRPLLYSDRDAAAALARSASWIRSKRAEDVRAIREGKPPSGPKWIVIGKSIFYRGEDLQAWISRNAVEHGVVPFSNRGTTAPDGAETA